MKLNKYEDEDEGERTIMINMIVRISKSVYVTH